MNSDFALYADKEPNIGKLAGDSKRSLTLQLIISIVFGLAAFLGFCILRPRWPSLYAARKRRKSQAALLPQLPRSMFGWIPVVWRITDEEILASAGLDAYAFLAFFRMAMKYTAFLFFFALSVIFPVILVFEPDAGKGGKGGKGKTNETETLMSMDLKTRDFGILSDGKNGTNGTQPDDPWKPWVNPANDYLWIYLIFVYFFSAVGVWLILRETQKMIQVRQKYLAAQSSISDRTIRLSGIPEDLRSEAKIKDMIENLEIGKVESVTLCRNWTELDDLVEERKSLLQELEHAWTQHLGKKKPSRRWKTWYRNESDGSNGNQDQSTRLLGHDEDDSRAHVSTIDQPRPEKRLWYGFLNLQSRKVDAIDYYEEKLRRQDERIRIARKKEYPPVPLAFVTLDSTAACQMACQAIIDPQPMQLMANPSPSPSGVVWRNTYLSRKTRMLRAWSITIFIFFLTIFWSFLLLPLVGISTPAFIVTIFPPFKQFLEDHKNFAALLQTGIPTLLLAILNVAVPYFYEYLSNLQGMTSLADVETSLISKNFFFIFFNLFVVFTMLRTLTGAATLAKRIDEHLRDLTKIAWTLRQGLEFMSSFYLNYIVLQTFGLFPFRLLQFGSVSLYPWYRLHARTPRDFSQLTQPGTFTYGFFVPQTLFMLLICVAYSVMPNTQLIQAIGFIYFALGAFIYKYQLLYSMDHRQFTAGRIWPMMCVRFASSLVIFQLVMVGQLAFKNAWRRSVLVAPLIIATVWFTIWYRRTYEPLMKNIALRTLREAHDEAEARMAESILSGTDVPSGEDEPESAYGGPRFRWPEPFPSLTGPNANGVGGATGNGNGNGGGRDARDGTKTRFVNPNLVKTLHDPWISNPGAREAELNGAGGGSGGGGAGAGSEGAVNES